MRAKIIPTHVIMEFLKNATTLLNIIYLNNLLNRRTPVSKRPNLVVMSPFIDDRVHATQRQGDGEGAIIVRSHTKGKVSKRMSTEFANRL